jgi:hypothetical protein
MSTFKWKFCHVDVVRAFLTARRQDEEVLFARLRGCSDYYKIMGALYGLRTSPHDFQESIVPKLIAQGFRRLAVSDCMFVRNTDSDVQLVYTYVDDFVWGGSNEAATRTQMELFRAGTPCTEAQWSPKKVLGCELQYFDDEQAVGVTMVKHIEKVYEYVGKFDTSPTWTPMTKAKYIVDPEEIATSGGKKGGELPADKERYMCIVGMLIWIAGARPDVLFTVMYLSWFSHMPTVHHMECAERAVSYLHTSKNLPLILGGKEKIRSQGGSDASLGTAKNSRSVLGHGVRLGSQAGLIAGKSCSATNVALDIFEGETDGTGELMKAVYRCQYLLDDIGIEVDEVPLMMGDNWAVADFLQGRGSASKSKHMKRRGAKLREELKINGFEFLLVPGADLGVDMLTKANNPEEHMARTRDLMGLALIGITSNQQLITWLGYQGGSLANRRSSSRSVKEADDKLPEFVKPKLHVQVDEKLGRIDEVEVHQDSRVEELD